MSEVTHNISWCREHRQELLFNHWFFLGYNAWLPYKKATVKCHSKRLFLSCGFREVEKERSVIHRCNFQNVCRIALNDLHLLQIKKGNTVIWSFVPASQICLFFAALCNFSWHCLSTLVMPHWNPLKFKRLEWRTCLNVQADCLGKIHQFDVFCQTFLEHQGTLKLNATQTLLFFFND